LRSGPFEGPATVKPPALPEDTYLYLTKADGTDQKADQLYPSIRELPILGVTYSDLSRELVMQEGIYETLNKQYELAKVQEAKEIHPSRYWMNRRFQRGNPLHTGALSS
jgi:hypothetical protein